MQLYTLTFLLIILNLCFGCEVLTKDTVETQFILDDICYQASRNVTLNNLRIALALVLVTVPAILTCEEGDNDVLKIAKDHSNGIIGEQLIRLLGVLTKGAMADTRMTPLALYDDLIDIIWGYSGERQMQLMNSNKWGPSFTCDVKNVIISSLIIAPFPELPKLLPSSIIFDRISSGSFVDGAPIPWSIKAGIGPKCQISGVYKIKLIVFRTIRGAKAVLSRSVKTGKWYFVEPRFHDYLYPNLMASKLMDGQSALYDPRILVYRLKEKKKRR